MGLITLILEVVISAAVATRPEFETQGVQLAVFFGMMFVFILTDISDALRKIRNRMQEPKDD